VRTKKRKRSDDTRWINELEEKKKEFYLLVQMDKPSVELQGEFEAGGNQSRDSVDVSFELFDRDRSRD
jgi:hypothetical protein